MTPHTSRLRPDGTTFPPVTPDPPPPPGYVDPLAELEADLAPGPAAVPADEPVEDADTDTSASAE